MLAGEGAQRAHIFGTTHGAMVRAAVVVDAERIVARQGRQRAPGLPDDGMHPGGFAETKSRGNALADSLLARSRRNPPMTGPGCRRDAAGAAIALVDQDHASARARGRHRGPGAGHAAADDEHVGRERQSIWHGDGHHTTGSVFGQPEVPVRCVPVRSPTMFPAPKPCANDAGRRIVIQRSAAGNFRVARFSAPPFSRQSLIEKISVERLKHPKPLMARARLHNNSIAPPPAAAQFRQQSGFSWNNADRKRASDRIFVFPNPAGGLRVRL